MKRVHGTKLMWHTSQSTAKATRVIRRVGGMWVIYYPDSRNVVGHLRSNAEVLRFYVRRPELRQT